MNMYMYMYMCTFAGSNTRLTVLGTYSLCCAKCSKPCCQYSIARIIPAKGACTVYMYVQECILVFKSAYRNFGKFCICVGLASYEN